jgi:HEAT repeat protein
MNSMAISMASTGMLLLWMTLGAAAAGREPAAASGLQDAQNAFDQGNYQQALDQLQQPDHRLLPAEARRLKIRAELRLGKPKEALLDYEQLAQQLGHDEVPLLRQVALGFITVLTKDMREQMRGAAYTALKDFESAETVPYLEDGLMDGSGLVRALAVEGLGKTEGGRRSAKLRQALEDQAGLVKAGVLKVLGHSGDRAAVPLFEKSLKDEQPVVRLAAAGALYHVGRTSMWEQVRAAAMTANPEERATALRLMGDLKDDRSLGILLNAITDPQPSVRGAAASALGDLGKVEGITALQHALEDKIPAVRTSAAIGLGDLHAKESKPALTRALSDQNPVVQAAAMSALLRLGEPVGNMRDTVDSLLQRQDPGTRSAVAKALGRSTPGRDEAAIDILSGLLADPIPRPRIAAARSLGQIGSQAAVPILKQALHDEDDAVRAAAGGALGRLLKEPDKQTKGRKT